MSEQAATGTSLPTSVLARYGAGQAGAQIFRDTPAALLPIFMTTLLGVPPWMAGIAILLPKLWVIFCDPMMGAFSDRLKPRYGRTPFLIAGAIFTSLGFVALFTFTGFSSPLLAAAAISVLFLLASTGFSAFSVPYLAIASELSDDTHERTKILSVRVLCSIVGVIIGVGVAQPLVYHFGGGAHGWRSMALILAAICLVTMLITAIGLRCVVRMDRPVAVQRGFLSQLGEALRNREFRLLTLTYLIQCVGQACGYTVIGFVFLYGFGNINLILPFVLVMAVGSMFAQPMWMALSRRHGKAFCFVLATIGWSLLTISWFFASPGTDVLAVVPGIGPVSTQQAFVLLRAFPVAIFNVGFLLFALSMLTDTIETVRDQNGGHADEGVFSGIFSATEKLSFAIGPVIAGFVMSASGFVSSTTGIVPQSASAITGVMMIYSFIPAAVVMLSLAPFASYAALRRQVNR